jgi:hypothetical protein
MGVEKGEENKEKLGEEKIYNEDGEYVNKYEVVEF